MARVAPRPGDRFRRKNRTIKAFAIPRSERVAEPPGDLVQGFLGGVGLQRPFGDAVQDPHVVDPGDVVGMRMSEQHRIRPRNAASQELSSHIR